MEKNLKNNMNICTYVGLPRCLSGKEVTSNAEAIGLIPASGRFPGGRHGYSLQYSCLDNPIDRGAWQATVHRVAKSQTQLNDGVHTHTYTHIGLSQGQYDKVFKIFCTQRVLEKG